MATFFKLAMCFYMCVLFLPTKLNVASCNQFIVVFARKHSALFVTKDSMSSEKFFFYQPVCGLEDNANYKEPLSIEVKSIFPLNKYNSLQLNECETLFTYKDR